MKRIFLAATASLALSSAASAELLVEKNIPLDLAVEIASEAVASCKANGYEVSAAVVDRAGVLRALMRSDDAGPHTPSSSTSKAYTSASLRIKTGEMADLIAKNPTAAELASIEGFLALGGGIPIKTGDVVIGGVGVGGAPGGHLDEACAQAGIDKVQDRLK